VYRGVLHETRDQPAMFAPVTKWAATVGDVGNAVLGAGQLALTAPTGPVYVGVPTDLLAMQTMPLASDSPPVAAPVPDVDAAVSLLAAAERPLIWAGGGALRAGAGEAVGELAIRLGAPVITTYMSRGLIPPDHPCAAPGPVHAPEVGALWDEADVVLAIGTDFDGMMTQNWLMPRPPRLIAVNVDAADANKNYAADLTLVGDARAVAEELVRQVPARGRRPAKFDVPIEDAEAARFLDVMERVLPDDAVVVADMCIPGYWLGGYRRVPLPRKLAYPVGWGTLGFAFPASIGAALAGAGPAVCVCGDGGFLYACGELATVAQEDISVTVVLVDDGGYGMLRYDQLRAGDEPFGVDLLRPDFQALAASFGIAAVRVDGFGGEFEQALAASVSGAGATVIVVNASLTPPPTTSPRWYRKEQSG
jgi:acetolactate synthase-1/2/3 large subunit